MSQDYRYYCHDASGHLHEPAWFRAESDQEAIDQIKAKHPGDKCEIWQGQRRVATLSPTRLRA